MTLFQIRGKEEEGTYTLNTNGAYVVMSDEKGENYKAYSFHTFKRNHLNTQAMIINRLGRSEVHYK